MSKKSGLHKSNNGGPELSTASPKTAPGRDAIAARAYELYVARGRVSGHELEDWIQAEVELTSRPRA